MDFEIEIVDAYEIDYTKTKDGKENKKKRKPRVGWSVHVYRAAYDDDLRGIEAKKLANGWFIKIPHFSNYDEEEERRVYFPVYCPTNPQNKKDLIEQINKKTIDFIEKKLVEEGQLKEKKFLHWKEREEKNQQKLKEMSEKRNQNPKYQKQNKKIIKGKK